MTCTLILLMLCVLLHAVMAAYLRGNKTTYLLSQVGGHVSKAARGQAPVICLSHGHTGVDGHNR